MEPQYPPGVRSVGPGLWEVEIEPGVVRVVDLAEHTPWETWKRNAGRNIERELGSLVPQSWPVTPPGAGELYALGQAVGGARRMLPAPPGPWDFYPRGIEGWLADTMTLANIEPGMLGRLEPSGPTRQPWVNPFTEWM